LEGGEARAAGVPLELLVVLRRANGLPVPEPDAVALTDLDVEAMRTAAAFREAGVSDEQMLRLHLRHAVGTEALGADERAAGALPTAREVGVAFADLVGFTRLGEELPPEELGALAARFAALAGDLASPPVRLVKTIGDAAMLVSADFEPLLECALDLHDAAAQEGEDFPALRVGVALGPAVARAGDWYGRPLNRASRITAVARPGSVLAERAVRDAARERYRWSAAGRRSLRGVDGPVALYRARRLDPAGAD
jgi:adenylate cyclase